jgi:cytochrome c-type biogenesis protein CcmH
MFRVQNTTWLGCRLALAVIACLLLVTACSSHAPTLEERAVELDRQLMCPVCDGQTLDESRSQLAQQMKQVIREKLAAGESEEDIKAYFSSPERYGTAVLAVPPASGFNAVLWFLPPVALAAGAACLYFVVRAMRRRTPRQAAATNGDQAALTPYLIEVDRDLGLAPDRAGQSVPAGRGGV